MKIETNYQKSKAREIDILFEKKKQLWGLKSGEDLANFKEPILQLARRDRTVSWFENATSGIFKFEHSSGEEREIQLDRRYLMNFNYGGKVFSGYWCHEDEAFPLPGDPVMSAEMFSIIINKILNDQLEWKAKLEANKGDWIMKIGFAIAIVIGVVVLAYVMAPEFVKGILHIGAGNLAPGVQAGANATKETIIQNISILN